MLRNNSLGADQIDRCVPDVIGIDDNHRAVSALIHATCVIHSDDVTNARFGYEFLQRSVDCD